MKKANLFIAAGLVLALGSAPAFSQDAASDPNAPGMKELGIDVSKAGTTADENKNYLASLPADQQAKVKEACLVQLVEPVSDHPPVVVAFCKNLDAAK